MAMSSRAGIRLPPHTFYARGDDVTILFPIGHWRGILAKRGTSPEEKGYYFCGDSGDGRVLSMFNVPEDIGTGVRCDSSDIALSAIEEFTARHQNMHIIYYHTHPIEGPSSRDLLSYIRIYERAHGKIRDFLTIGPRTVELNRVYPAYIHPRVQDIARVDAFENPTSGLVQIIRFTESQKAGFKSHTENLGREYHSILRKIYGR